jgi:hypothetical protein
VQLDPAKTFFLCELKDLLSINHIMPRLSKNKAILTKAEFRHVDSRQCAVVVITYMRIVKKG